MKVAIIGAGVSGITAGCYLQMNGFQTEIFEQHSNAGGLCTSWYRNGFTFESGFQWLLGSAAGSPFYQLWSELLDMESILFFQHEVRMEIEVKASCDKHGSKVFHLYTDIQRLENYLMEIAPEDKRPIRHLIKRMRRIQSHEIPPLIKMNPQTLSFFQKLRYIRYLPLLLFMNRIKKETNISFASRLRNPFLKEAFELLFDGECLPLMIITLPLAFNDLKGTAYPIGGAARFVEKLRERYQEFGGVIRFNSPVEKISTKGGYASGLLLENGEEIHSGIVLSAADWEFTMFHALEGKYVDKTMLEMRELKRLQLFYSVFMVSLGVSRTFDDAPHFLRFPLEKELLSPDGTSYAIMESHIYNYDPTLAPKGKTVVVANLSTQNADYWIKLRQNDRDTYNRIKNEFAATIISILDQKLGNITAFVEVTDVATPATFQRYTKNRQGSTQGWMPGKNLVAQTPITNTLKGLKNFYYSSHWSQPGGGLPVAIKSARDTVQLICHDLKMPFRIKPWQ